MATGDGGWPEEEHVRPTTILSLLAGFLIALVARRSPGVFLFVDRDRGYALVLLGRARSSCSSFGVHDAEPRPAVLDEVGKLEVKGRPRRVA